MKLASIHATGRTLKCFVTTAYFTNLMPISAREIGLKHISCKKSFTCESIKDVDGAMVVPDYNLHPPLQLQQQAGEEAKRETALGGKPQL
jgi:hypothetical protein